MPMTAEDVVLLAAACVYSKNGNGRRIRQRAGVSLESIATAIESSKAVLSRWERGERRPTGRQAIEWARLLADMERRMNRIAARA